MRGRGGRMRRWALGLLPLVLLAGLVAVFFRTDPMAPLRAAFPPVEDLTLERVTFPEAGQMRLHLVNGGPEPVTVAQVLVDEAYWRFRADGDLRVPRLGRRVLELEYPWVEGEPHEISVVTSTGLVFSREVEVATRSPRPDAASLGGFALLGIYVGVIPVALGLLWYPFLRRLRRKWLHFFLSVTVGLLVFLGADALAEAFETAALVPAAFRGVGLVVLGVGAAFLGLRALANLPVGRGPAPSPPPGAELVEEDGRAGPPDGPGGREPVVAGGAPPPSGLRLAYLIALGIGLHNLGEGLAIGAAYAVGEVALGAFLVVGFALHNTTEGLAIVAPAARDRSPLWHLPILGALAGVPTVFGAWIGGFSFSPIWATFFFALGVGAILQVVVEVGAMIRRDRPAGLFAPLNAAGLALGLIIMYGTALLVTG